MAAAPSSVVVTRSFGGYARGTRIDDAAAIASILAGSARRNVVAISAPAAAPDETPAQEMQAAVAAGVAAAEAALHPAS